MTEAQVEEPFIPAAVMQAARDQVVPELRALQDRIRQQRKELREQGRANQRIWMKFREVSADNKAYRERWLESERMKNRLAMEIQFLKGWDLSQLLSWMQGLK